MNLIPSTAQRRRWFEIVISGLIIPTYLRLYFSDIARGQAKNPNHNLIQFAALLSRLVCMFQDSVPDGSYNDPFLSSVCTIWTDVKLLIGFHQFAGGARDHCKSGTNKDTCLDLWYQKGTPFWRTCQFYWNGKRLNPRTSASFIWQFHFTVAVDAISNHFWDLYASEPSSDSSPKPYRRQYYWFFDLFSPRSCRRWTVGYFGKQSPKHYFGFQHAGQNSLESG